MHIAGIIFILLLSGPESIDCKLVETVGAQFSGQIRIRQRIHDGNRCADASIMFANLQAATLQNVIETI